MSRRPTRALALALALIGAALAACTAPTAPTPVAKSLQYLNPSDGASHDEIVQADSTCRTGFSVGNAHTCI